MNPSKADFTAIKTQRAYEHIVAQVEAAIASGSLRPGEHLPSEREMMEGFGVSRPTIREALRVLESNGLVRSKHGNPFGPEILEPSTELLHRPMAQLVRTKHLSLSEFLPIRIVLEGLACAIAATTRTAEHLDDLERAVIGMREASNDDADLHRFGEADVAFHSTVWDATGNLLIAMFGNVTRDLMGQLIEEKIAHAPDARALMALSVEHDAEILAAIRAGDPMLASYLARRYIYDYYNDYVPEAERAPLRTLVGVDPREHPQASEKYT
ncbi:MAG: FadR/GntR family transcriptional regulator [Gordonia sp. (in: high G+C Gram-positive bacteria)]